MVVVLCMAYAYVDASVGFFVLSFVLPCTYAYVASEDQRPRLLKRLLIGLLCKAWFSLAT